MMPDDIELVIVTPEKQLLRGKVADMQMPGENGYLGVLPGHAPLMTELGIGELSYHDVSGKESTHLAIVRGFAEVLPDRVTVLAETAERAKSFLKERGISFREVNIEEDSSGEKIVINANNGLRRVPTLEVGGRYFACSPFDAEQLAEELNIPLNP